MDIEYTLIRKNIKNIYIRISSDDGNIVVTAPYLCSKTRIEKFLLSKRNWIEDKRSEILSKPKYVPDANDTEILITKINRYLPIWEERTGLYCSSWTIKNMKSRWGSCNTKTGKLTFNLQLIMYPDCCLEYIILHELCHLKVHNHSKDFYDLVSKYMPDYKAYRKMLNVGK